MVIWFSRRLGLALDREGHIGSYWSKAKDAVKGMGLLVIISVRRN